MILAMSPPPRLQSIKISKRNNIKKRALSGQWRAPAVAPLWMGGGGHLHATHTYMKISLGCVSHFIWRRLPGCSNSRVHEMRPPHGAEEGHVHPFADDDDDKAPETRTPNGQRACASKCRRRESSLFSLRAIGGKLGHLRPRSGLCLAIHHLIFQPTDCGRIVGA